MKRQNGAERTSVRLQSNQDAGFLTNWITDTGGAGVGCAYSIFLEIDTDSIGG